MRSRLRLEALVVVLGVFARRRLVRRLAHARRRAGVRRQPAAPPGAGSSATLSPAVALGQRAIVVLRTPSVAQRLSRIKLATGQDERRWTAQVRAAQQQVLTQLARHGIDVRPDYTLRPRARRLRGAARPAGDRAPLAQPGGRGDLRGAGSVPDDARDVDARAGRRGAVGGDGAAGLRRERRLDRASGHGRRPLPDRTSAAASSPGSTSSTATTPPMPSRTRRAPSTSSATAPSSPACSSARAAPAASTARRPARTCCRSGSPAGSPTAGVASSSTRAATS